MPVSTEWVQLSDGDAGKTNYCNRRTNSTVWKAPAGVEVVWVGSQDERGLRYFWHRVSRVSRYDLPPGRGTDRQPRAVYKYWEPCRLCCVEIFFIVNNEWSLVLPSTWHTARVGSDHEGSARTGFMGVRAFLCGLDYDQFPLRLFCGDGFRCPDSVWAPRFWQPLFPSRRLKSQGCGVFWEIPSGNVPLFCAIWYDSGYTLRQFTVSVWQQRQVCTVQTVPGFGLSARSHLPSPLKKWPRTSFTTVVWLVLLVTMHLALCLHFTLCSTRSRQAQDFRHHGRYGQEALHQPVEIPQVQFLVC